MISRVRNLKRLLPGLLISAALAACGGGGGLKVVPLHGDGFSVNMVGTPQRMVRTIQTVVGPQQITLYASRNGSQGYSIATHRFSTAEGFNLDGAVQGEVAGVHGTLQSVRTTTYQGFPARDASITGQSNGTPFTVFERTILAKREVFELQFARQGTAASPPAPYTTFLSSLKIT